MMMAVLTVSMVFYSADSLVGLKANSTADLLVAQLAVKMVIMTVVSMVYL
jgi:hypothetical protein